MHKSRRWTFLRKLLRSRATPLFFIRSPVMFYFSTIGSHCIAGLLSKILKIRQKSAASFASGSACPTADHSIHVLQRTSVRRVPVKFEVAFGRKIREPRFH